MTVYHMCSHNQSIHNNSNNGAAKSDAINLKEVSLKDFLFFFSLGPIIFKPCSSLKYYIFKA